jgi:hypothetical protein
MGDQVGKTDELGSEMGAQVGNGVPNPDLNGS